MSSSLSKNFSAGINGYLTTLPGTITFGAIVFAPLGADWVAKGIFACFLGHFLLGIFTSIFSNSEEMISGPRSFVAVAYSSVIASVTLQLEPVLGINEASLIGVMAAILTGCLSGFLQLILGLMKFGNLVKFIPYPIISSLINSAAILILLAQLRPLFGLPYEMPLWDISNIISSFNLFSALIAAITITIFLICPKKSFGIPSALVACIIGFFAHHSLVILGISSDPGNTLPKITLEKIFYQFPSALNLTEIKSEAFFLLAPILISAIMLAALNSINLLFTSKQLARSSSKGLNANRDLFTHGWANFLTASLGGIPGSGKIGATMVSINSGAKGRSAPIFVAVFYLLSISLLLPWMHLIPISVIAGMSAVLCFRLVDDDGKQLFLALCRFDLAKIKENSHNYFIILIVVSLSVSVGFFAGIIGGLFATLVDIVIQTSRFKVIIIPNGSKRSRVERSSEENAVLLDKFDRLHIVEIEGCVLFSTAENIEERVIFCMNRPEIILILDFYKCTYIDQTGLELLSDLISKFRKNGNNIIVVGLNDYNIKTFNDKFAKAVKTQLEIEFFTDIDSALEFAEDILIQEAELDSENFGAFENSDLVRDLSPKEISNLKRYTTKKTFSAGQIVRQNDELGGELFIITNGLVDVFDKKLNPDKNNATTRLFSYKPGSIIGEVTFIDGGRPSADAICRIETECCCLTRNDFDKFASKEPKVAIIIMTNLAHALATRIRSTNKIVGELN